MNVLMVTSSYPKFPGDATAPFIESIAHAVAARGHSVDMVLPEHPDLAPRPDDPVQFFPYRYAPRPSWRHWGYAQSLEADFRVRRSMYLLAPLAALGLRREIGERLAARRYDVVHVHWVVPNAVLIGDILRAQQTPFVVSLHGSDVFVAERLWLARLLAERVLRIAGSVTACSDDLHRRSLALGARPKRTHTVPYGVDVVAFAPGPRDGELRAHWAVPEDAFLVLAVGRLVEKKGFGFLIEAASHLPHVHVVVAGDGDLRADLEAQARRQGVPVRFLGRVSRTGVAGALAAADAVVVPSVVDRAGNVDGLPNTLLEALAAGRPVVATRVAGIPDVVEHDRNGLLVPEKDSAALTAAIARLAREPETRRRLGAEARRTAVERLSWEATARAFEDCYAEAAALEAR